MLIVEGDEEIGTKLADYLGARGMTGVAVDSLPSARQLLKSKPFDAVLLDLNLGEHAGLALAREVAESGGPPVVIASSRVSTSMRMLTN